ncbi:hypothetical protein ACIRPH_26245 [Nocardiopsis sp. NPDC101807]|uniref:hypothetical protein n=1 Tax=Nocardiopsis sp. NPDC101807 TaxID=3364339 RepID=UPI003821A814
MAVASRPGLYGQAEPSEKEKSLFFVVRDSENYDLEELIQMYLDEGFDREHAETYAKIAKNPPDDIRIE